MAKNSTSTEVKQTNAEVDSTGLRLCNKWLAGIYVVQGLVFALLATTQLMPVQASYLTADPLASDISGSPVTGIATAHLLDINIVHLVAAFFFIAAIAHALMATVYRAGYEADLKQRLNKLRWVEYAVSGGAMLLAVALLSGIADAATLLAIGVLTILTMLCGLAMEQYNQGKTKITWLAYGLGAAAALTVGAIFALYAWSTNIYGTTAVPGFVWGLYATLFVFGVAFAVNLRLHLKKAGKWKDYVYAERTYMFLSIAAKTAIAWQIFAGALRP